jgi:hypothetical protein
MSTTQSGRHLLPHNYGIPSLHDIAIQSGRLVRFTGACRVHWTVLHHLFVCRALVDLCDRWGAETVWSADVERTDASALITLLHEPDELATNDVPSPWKTVEHRRMVDPLQQRTYGAYLGRVPTEAERAFNKFIDMLSLVAEMIEVGPPGSLEYSGLAHWAPVFDRHGMLPGARHIVKGAHATAPLEIHTMRGLDSTLVLWYLRELEASGVRNPYNENLNPFAQAHENPHHLL